jgi:beta-glucosidase
MRTRVGDRLPKFTADEAAFAKGALDFVGINHYTTYYTRHNTNNTLADTGTISLRGFPISVRHVSC